MSYRNVPAAVAATAESDARKHGSTLTHAAGPDDLDYHRKHDRLKPKMRDAIATFGEQFYDPATDTLTVPLKSRRDRMKVKDLHHDENRREVERGEQLEAGSRADRIRIRSAGGGLGEISAHNEAAVVDRCRRLGIALRPVAARGRPTQLRRDASGLLWRMARGRWEPTGKCAITRPWRPCVNQGCSWCGAAS